MKIYKIIGFLLIFSLLLPLCAGAQGNSVVFNIALPADMPKAGEEFNVSIDIANNPGFNAMQFTLEYDNAAMSCKKIIVGKVLKDSFSALNPEAREGAVVVAASVRALEGDGTLAVFRFIADEDIAEFDFVLKDIVVLDGQKANIKYNVVGAREDVKEPEHSELPTDTEKEPADADEEVADEKTDFDIIADNKENDGGEAIAKPEDKEEESQPDNVEITESPKQTFPDVVGHWAESFVDEAVERGLFVGGADGDFHPDDNVTRAQFITVLWRMSGKEKVDVKVPFVDIENEIPEFKDAIAWGYAKGYINGVSDIEFEPSTFITREAGMKILHFCSGGKVGAEIQLYTIYNSTFKDSSQISGWAKPSVYWGIYNKLISGMSSDILGPTENATRAQLAKILINYLNIK